MISLINKFESFQKIVKDNVDISLIWKTELDDSFPTEKLLADGFNTPFRIERNKFGGGLSLYFREGLLSKTL